MINVRKSYPVSLRTKVVLAALREDTTIAELAAEYGLNPGVIQRWKKAALEGLTEGLKDKKDRGPKDNTEVIKDLHAKIGELTVERDFLEQASVRLGLGGAKKW